MNPLPAESTDQELFAFVDRWAALLEQEDYQAAYEFTDHDTYQNWTPNLIKDVVKAYGEAVPTQRVTVNAEAGLRQHKEVMRWERNANGAIGLIWYDLFIDNTSSDLTATFFLVEVDGGLSLQLDDIHVM